MKLSEVKAIINGMKDADDLPVKVKYADAAVGAVQVADLESVIEELTHGPEPKRELIFCAKG